MLDAGFGYGPVFAIVSTLHVTAFAVILSTVTQASWPAFDRGRGSHHTNK
jgi:hypothetical protein